MTKRQLNTRLKKLEMAANPPMQKVWHVVDATGQIPGVLWSVHWPPLKDSFSTGDSGRA